ncbi:MAG: hypothetical protein AABO41_08825 [Acidobacteriota bacterium]
MSSILTADEEPFRAGFWQRQFSSNSTTYQVVFDVMFGILMPLVCFYFDPGIIRDGAVRLFSPTLLHAVLVYSLSAIAILTLIVWLSFANCIKAAGAIISGIFVSGAVCSFTIGIIILPLTAVGLLFIIGILGLVPFVTGFVYLRNALRAIRSATPILGRPILASAVSVGLLIAAGLPAIGEFTISRIVTRSMNQLLTQQDSRSFEEAVGRIKYLGWADDLDRLVRAYETEPNRQRKDRLAKAYKEITGQEIEDRLSILND